MRLSILDDGHASSKKLLFALIRTASRQPVPEAVKLVMYRPDFYGDPMKTITQDAMRGPSSWSVAERELMAAVVSKSNGCDYCTRAHAAVSSRAYGSRSVVDEVLAGSGDAGVAPALRATLEMLRTLSVERTLRPSAMQRVLDAGASSQQIEDALAVAFAFNTMNRLADAFGFVVGGPEAFEAGAKYLLARGYR